MDSIQVVLTLAALGLAVLAVASYGAERRRIPAPASPATAAGERTEARIADTTHELRTPVAGMIGMAGLLLDTPLTPEQTTYAEAIRASGQALLTLVDDLLEAAAEAAGAAPKVQSFSPQLMVEQVVELLAPRALEKGLDIAGFAAPGLPPRLLGDAGKLRQILLNLAGNAVKYTENGGVGVRIEQVRDGIAFAVHDTGPGIPEEVRRRLFARFERGAAPEAGAGLGLAIVAGLAARLGGRLAVEGAPGRGTSFVFTLALEADPARQPAAPSAPAGLDVVVAARSPFAGPWLVEGLAAAGARAELVGDAEAAAARLARRRCDVLIADRALGAEMCRIAEAARATGCRTVALATPTERRDLDGLRAAGFDHFLVKPVRAGSLLTVLGRPPAIAVPPGRSAAAGSAGRALLAEDDEVSALLAVAQLTRLGYATERVVDGGAAIAAYGRALGAARPFDLVLLDLGLPVLDGCGVARQIRALETTRRAPRAAMLAITADPGAEQQHRAAAAGMDGVLGKPLERAALLAALAPRAAAV